MKQQLSQVLGDAQVWISSYMACSLILRVLHYICFITAERNGLTTKYTGEVASEKCRSYWNAVTNPGQKGCHLQWVF